MWGGAVYILKLVSYKQVQLQTRFHSHHPNVHTRNCYAYLAWKEIHQFRLSHEKVTSLAYFPFLENVDKTWNMQNETVKLFYFIIFLISCFVFVQIAKIRSISGPKKVFLGAFLFCFIFFIFVPRYVCICCIWLLGPCNHVAAANRNHLEYSHFRISIVEG